MNLADAMERAQVLDFELQKQLVPLMRDMVPLPGIYDPAFIAANQAERADNVIKGTKREQVGGAALCMPLARDSRVSSCLLLCILPRLRSILLHLQYSLSKQAPPPPPLHPPSHPPPPPPCRWRPSASTSAISRPPMPLTR